MIRIITRVLYISRDHLLSSARVNATEAERIGWVNSVFTTAKGLRVHVQTPAARIVRFNADAIRAAKKSISQQKPTQAMFEKDQATFADLESQPVI